MCLALLGEEGNPSQHHLVMAVRAGRVRNGSKEQKVILELIHRDTEF